MIDYTPAAVLDGPYSDCTPTLPLPIKKGLKVSLPLLDCPRTYFKFNLTLSKLLVPGVATSVPPLRLRLAATAGHSEARRPRSARPAV